MHPRPTLGFLSGLIDPDRPAPTPGRPPARVLAGARPPPEPVRVPEPLWSLEVDLRVPSDASPAVRACAVRAVESAWSGLDGVGVRFARPWPGASRSRVVVTLSELLALLPGPELPAPDLDRPTRAPESLPLGRTVAGAVVAVPVEPDQGRHLAILGETGMGKSSLLVSLAVRAARWGGLILLDPIGETAREVREQLASEGDRVWWVAPGAEGPTINALAGLAGPGARDAVMAERCLADIVHALRRVRSARYTDSAYWGPRLEEMLSRAVRAAASLPGGTLEDAHTLLSTSGITRRPLPHESSAAVRELAERVRERPEDADGARRLLYEVVRNPTLSRMLCARTPELSVREFVHARRIVLVSGEAARVGESTARYLLAVYLALLWSELLAAPDREKTFVALDEAQWFAHESLAEMLRLARRRNVHLLLATQSIASLPAEVAEAVWTNVADFVAFRGSPDEAREFGRAAPEAGADQLLRLARGQAAALIGKGSSVRWIRSARLPRVPRRLEDPRADAGETELAAPARASVFEPGLETQVGAIELAPLGPLDWLRARASERGGPGPVAVGLAELRAAFPDRPDAVRRVGAILGRSGALRRTERTADGTVWWLDPDRLAEVTPPDRPSRDGASSAPQPS